MGISFALPLLVSICGIILLVRLRFFFILHPLRTARVLLRTLSDRRARSSLALALAGTLGVGNIFGVCAGIMLGGAGSVFWLAASSLFSMAIKYAECALSFSSLDSGHGGMHYVIAHTYGKLAVPLSHAYAVLCTLLALFMGSAVQSNALSDVTASAYGVSPIICAIVLGIFLAIGVIGGGEKIEKITAKLIPLTTIIYILLTLSVIFANISRLPEVIKSIFDEAFSLSSAGGGILAFLSSRALSEGYARGILSNEAGVGTSSLAHTRARDRTPAEAGVCGICEVFFDTTLLCTLTALAVLCAVPNFSAFKTPMSLISAAVSTLGDLFTLPLALSILIFAYSTVICWFYYGGECVSYLFSDTARKPYSILFFAFIFIGALMRAEPLISVTDLIIFFMALITLTTIIRRIDEVKKSTLGM